MQPHLAAACRWLQEGRVIYEDQVKTPFKKVKKRGAEAPALNQEVISCWGSHAAADTEVYSDCLSGRGRHKVCSDRHACSLWSALPCQLAGSSATHRSRATQQPSRADAPHL